MEVNEGDNNEAVSVKEIFLKYFLKIFLRGLSKKYKEMNWSLSMNHYSEWKNLSTGYLYLKYIGTNEDNQRTTRKWYWKTSKNKTCSGKLLHTLIRGVFRDLKFFFHFLSNQSRQNTVKSKNRCTYLISMGNFLYAYSRRTINQIKSNK